MAGIDHVGTAFGQLRLVDPENQRDRTLDRGLVMVGVNRVHPGHEIALGLPEAMVGVGMSVAEATQLRDLLSAAIDRAIS